MNKKYSVVTINIGGYEIVHEIAEKSDNAEYIYITDDPTIKSETWTIKLIDNEFPQDNFYTVFKIRYNIFDYINTDTAIVVDGSIGIMKNLDILIDEMNNNNKDCCLFLHNYNTTLNDEYSAWSMFRNYPTQHIEKIKEIVGNEYFYSYKGIFVKTLTVIKNTENINKSNQLTFEYTKMLCYENDKKVDRLDQTIYTYILHKYFEGLINPLYLSSDILNSGKYFQWYIHNTNKRCYSIINEEYKKIFKYYAFNKEVEISHILD